MKEIFFALNIKFRDEYIINYYLLYKRRITKLYWKKGNDEMIFNYKGKEYV